MDTICSAENSDKNFVENPHQCSAFWNTERIVFYTVLGELKRKRSYNPQGDELFMPITCGFRCRDGLPCTDDALVRCYLKSQVQTGLARGIMLITNQMASS